MPPKFDSIELKNNKMNLADCASQLGFSKNQLLVTSNEKGWKSARAILPVPEFNRNAKKAYIAFYFEGHIKQTSSYCYGVGMGFCSYQFPLKGDFIGNGKQKNSIGFLNKRDIFNCGKWEHIQVNNDYFKAGDKIGLGLIYEPKNASIKCFAICNRKILGSVQLSPKFFDVPIFPVVGFYQLGDSIQLNFGKEDWDFDPRQIIPLIQ